MSDIDSLDIRISAEANSASTALNNLVSKLGTLSGSLGKLNSSGLKSFSNSMQTFTTAMQGIKDVNASQFTKVAKGIQKFESIDSGKIASVSNAMKPLAESINTLNGLTFDGKNITSFVNALAKLSQTNVSSLNSVNFAQLGNSIKSMTNSLSGASDVSRNTIAVTNAIAKLGATGGVIGQVTTSLPSLGVALKSFINSMASVTVVNSEVIAFTAALGQLASAGARTATTSANLGTLAVELKNFFTVMASAPTVNSNIIQMTQALANLSTQSANVGTTSKALVSGLNNFSIGAKKSTKSVTSLAAAFGKFYATFWVFIRLFNKVKDVMDISSDMTEVQNVVDVTFKQYSDAIEDFAGTTSITEFGISELTAKTIASRYQAMANAIGLTNDEAASANNFLASMTDSYVDANGTVADMSVNLTKLAADMASLYNVEASEVAESLESIYTGTTKPLRQYGLDLTQATLQEWALKNGLDADISSMTQAEKVMLRYQYVLANTTDAQGDFARTADTWANRIKVLNQQIEAWEKIIGEVFINAFKPALRALNSFMTSIINATQSIADALGKIFGWTIDTSSLFGDADDDIDSIADGLSDATDAAKALNKQLQGFDELNNLTTSSSDSGSGDSDSSSLSYGNATIVSTDESLIDYYESKIGSLAELGVYISKNLTNALNNIDWDSIYSGARNFGTGLASFLNGLISPELFGAVGGTIAKSLNTAIYTALSFGQHFDFTELGVSLGTGINEFFENLDAEALAETIHTWVQGGLDLVKGLLETTDFEEIGTKIGEFLGNLDLEEFLDDIAECIKLAIGGALDLCESWFEEDPPSFILTLAIGTVAVTGLADKLLAGVSSALGIGGTVGGSSTLTALFAPIGSAAGVSVGAAIFGGLAAAILGFEGGLDIWSNWTELFSPNDQHWYDEFKWLGDDGFFAEITDDWGTTFDALGDMATISPDKNGWNNFIAILTDILVPAAGAVSSFKQFTKLLDKIKSKGEEFGTKLKTAFENLGYEINSVSDLTDALKDIIKTTMENVVDWAQEKLIDPIKNKFEDFKDKVQIIFTTLKTSVLSIWSTVATWFSANVTQPIQTKFEDFRTKTQTIFSNLKANVLSVWSVVSTWFSTNVIEPIRTKFESFGNTVQTIFSNIKTKVLSIWSTVSTWFGTNITQPIQTKFSNLGTNVSNIFTTVKTSITSAFSTVKTFVTGSIITPIINKFTDLKTKVTSIFDNLLSSIKSIWNSVASYINSKLKIRLDTSTILGRSLKTLFGTSTITLATIPTYATGGFPEDGWFRASQGEIMGTFDNGQSVVANNYQITEGISMAVKEGNQESIGLMRQELAMMQRQNELLLGILEKETGITKKDLFNSVRQSASEYTNRTGNPAFI